MIEPRAWGWRGTARGATALGPAEMAAVLLWVSSDLRRRWRSWVVLGLLAGVVVGLAAAAVAGARRTSDALPQYRAATGRVDAEVLPNNPAFDAGKRAKVAALPSVAQVYPFGLFFLTRVPHHPDFWPGLTPTTPRAERAIVGPLVAGRLPNPRRADEVAVDENARAQFGLSMGTTLVLEQIAPPGPLDLAPALIPAHLDRSFRTRLRVVGIAKSVQDGAGWVPSPGFYAANKDRLVGVVNMFVRLRRGDADFGRFQRDVQGIMGQPINVVNVHDSERKTLEVMDLEQQGLLLFALAVLLAGTVLVGQALVRAVNADAADFPTWRAMGADRRIIVASLTAQSALAALIAAATALAVAIGISSRFPIGLARRYDLAVGVHADGLVLGVAALAAMVAVVGVAFLGALWSATRGPATSGRPSAVAGWVSRAGFPPALQVGSMLALDPGRGRRAVPVRSAFIGAIAGVLGVVACFTLRAGIDDVIAAPQRSGIVWDFEVANGAGTIAAPDLATIGHDPAVAAALRATWLRALPMGGDTISTFGTEPLRGAIALVVLHGRGPRRADEVALAPATMRRLHTHIGAPLAAGGGSQRVRVVGEVLLPETSHTSYDEGAWLTAAGLHHLMSPDAQLGPDDIQDAVFIRWKPGANVAAAQTRIGNLPGGYSTQRASLPSDITALGSLHTLPLVLGIFLALLAVATLAHTLVTTARRRGRELAVLRAFGFSRRQTRVAVAWQASLIALIGVTLGVPVGIALGRTVWRQLADGFPFVYTAPLALVAVLVIIPAAIGTANLIAAGPSHRAGRLRPAEVLRTE